jgi:hypothetical protein
MTAEQNRPAAYPTSLGTSDAETITLLGHDPDGPGRRRRRHRASSWQVAGAEFLEPDDLDQTEPVGVRAQWLGGVHDEPEI